MSAPKKIEIEDLNLEGTASRETLGSLSVSKEKAPSAPKKPSSKDRAKIDPRVLERRERYVRDRREGRLSLVGPQKLRIHDCGGQLVGYHATWVNDYPGNVQRYLDMGYAPVYQSDAVKIGDLAEDYANRLGTWINVIVGKTEENQPLRAFLLKIPQEWYDQDRAEKTQERIRKEKQIFGDRLEKHPRFKLQNGEYGEEYLNREKGIYARKDLSYNEMQELDLKKL